MPKLNLQDAARIKHSGGEILKLKGPGFSWSKPLPVSPHPPIGNVLILHGFPTAGTATQTAEIGATNFEFFNASESVAVDPADTSFLGDYAAIVETTKVVAGDNPSFIDFGTSDFTIESWIKPTSIASDGLSMPNKWNNNDASFAFYYSLLSPNVGRWVFEMSPDGFNNSSNVTVFPDIGGPALNVWTHVAAVRQGDFLSLYINGLRNGPPIAIPASFSMHNSNAIMRYGYTKLFPLEMALIGYIDEIRISDVAVYTEPEYQVLDVQYPRT